jgi:DNA-directed RNA polymerase subunit RPC12/RpoP
MLVVVLVVGCPEPKPRAGIVAGSSMSPSIPGRHYVVPCAECGFSFTCDIEQAEKRQHLICPNCGSRIDPSNCERMSAATVDIQLSPSRIARWDVIAFKTPVESETDESPSASIKRVVGLPGEAIEIRGGNLFANGNIVRKDLEQQKALRIPVHDTFHVSDHDRHWAFYEAKGWQTNPSFRFVPNNNNQGIEWLRFLNQRNYSHAPDSSQSDKPFPIEDFYAFNQSLSRDLNPMDEVFVAMDVRFSAGSLLAWRFDYRGTIHEFQVDAVRSELRVNISDASIQAKPIPLDANLFADPVSRIEFSSFDLQLSVWFNGKAVFSHELEESEEPVSCQPLIFGAAKNQLVFDRIQIWRDLYYFPAPGSLSLGPTTVSRHGYFVIGDNVPISVDSRHWRSASILQSDIIGKVILP